MTDTSLLPQAPPSVDRRRAQATAVFELVLCSSVPTQLMIAWALTAAGWHALGTDGEILLPFVLAVLLADSAILIALMVLLTRAHGESVRELWLGRRPVLGEGTLGALLIPVVFLLVVALLFGLRATAPWLHNLDTNPLEQLAGTPAEAAAVGLVGILAGGVREELQRAFLLRRFEQHLGGPVVGVVVLSVAFGLGHLVQGWDAAVTTGVLGAFWAVIYLRRRSTIAPMVSHAGFNALEVLRLAAMNV
jgi:membrane protease YdiL (CAAX protease family)